MKKINLEIKLEIKLLPAWGWASLIHWYYWSCVFICFIYVSGNKISKFNFKKIPATVKSSPYPYRNVNRTSSILFIYYIYTVFSHEQKFCFDLVFVMNNKYIGIEIDRMNDFCISLWNNIKGLDQISYGSKQSVRSSPTHRDNGFLCTKTRLSSF